jgi:iron complex outermembrane recepter protein
MGKIRVTKRRRVLAVGAAALWLTVQNFAVADATADVERQHVFNIQAQRADRALTIFARQAKVTLVFQFDAAWRRRANTLVGEYTLQEGLALLLRGTGLEGSVESNLSIVIRAGVPPDTVSTTGEKMEMTRKPAGIIGALLALVAGAPSAQGQQSEGSAAGPVAVLDEVVVTARKRTEKLLDVPVAVTAFSGEALEQRGSESIGDFLQEAPGVNLFDRGNGYKLSIRGISTSLGANENGYYLDELPFTGVTVPINPDVRSWDLERVEVLRGPQGTLFGEGSMGGTVRILTRDPVFNEWGAKATLMASNTSDGGGNRGAKVMFNVPIIDDRLALRVAATREKYDGWIDDSVSGQDDINEQDLTSYRAKLKFEPTEALSFTASYWHFDGEYPAGSNGADDFGNADQGVRLASGQEYDLAGLTVNYDFGSTQLFYSFADNSLKLPQRGSLFGGTLVANVLIDVQSNELRLSSSGEGAWQWTLGAYKREAVRKDALTLALFGIDNLGRTDATSEALFGEVTYTLSGAPVDLSAGLRAVREELAGVESNSGVPVPAAGGKFDSVNPRFIAAWRPNDAWRVYVSAAKGYRSGQNQPSVSLALAGLLGIPLQATLQDDSIWSYEIGTKASLADGRAVFETALYHSKWEDVTVRFPLATTGFNGLINSEGTETTGVEAALTVLLGDAWRVNLSASYSDAAYAGNVPGTGIRDGSPVDDHADTTASLSVDYNRTVFGGLRGSARIGAQYASERDFPSIGPPQFLPGDATTTLDARFGLEGQRWGVHLFVDNLTDEDGAVAPRSVMMPLPATAIRQRPRTVGIDITFDL